MNTSNPTVAAAASNLARTGLLGLTAVALAATTGCASMPMHAASRRPTVVLAHEANQCRPRALVDIDNPGHCSVQLVARGADREVLAASDWIRAGQQHASYPLPERFTWITLEVDPLCDRTVGKIRYRESASTCDAPAASIASR